MLGQLRSLTRDSLIYGVGHIVTRVVTFLLLPYYSFRLTPAEYGELTLYFLFVAVAQTFFLYGLDIAFLRYFSLAQGDSQRRVINGTTTIAATLTSVILAGGVLLAAPSIGRLLIHSPVHPEIVNQMVRLCAGILFFDTLATFPFLLLRSTLRTLQFTLTKVANVSINIALNLVFVGSLNWGLPGVLWANLISSVATYLMLLPSTLSMLVLHFERSLLREMVRFGLPNVPTYLFVMVIELADRKFLEVFRGLEEAGLYSAGYKLGMFMAVVTGAFRFAWQPFFLSHSKDENAPRLFARVLTYYLLVTALLLLLLSFFVGPLIRFRWPGIGYLLDPRYWSGLAVLPIILAAHVFDGVYANFMVGVYLKKLTHKLPLVTGVAAAFTVIGNFLLVPRWGMMAAAWITLIAFALEALLAWFVVRRAYPVPYEWRRLATLSVTCIVCLIPGMTLLTSWGWRIGLVALFPCLLYIFGFFDERERYHLKRLVSLT